MLKKILILLLVFMFTSYSFAQDGTKEKDCGYIENLQSTKEKIYGNGDYKIVDEDVYQKAMNNLQTYCGGDSSVLETNVFINHLLDISFRKLDGIKGYSYGVKFDDKSEQWRNYLNEIQKEYETPPSEIYNKFIELRGNTKSNIKANNDTIYGKYLLACNELQHIYPVVKNQQTYDGNELTINAFGMKCKELVKKRYAKELSMLQKVMFQNYYHVVNKTLYKVINQVIGKKLGEIYDKTTENLGKFEHVVRRYMHVTDANE